MDLKDLVEQVETARENFMQACSGLTHEEANYKSSEDSWSVTNVAEHIVRAEWGGLNGIWSAIEGYKRNVPVWSGDNYNKGLSIEVIVEKTWQRHQSAPEPARPQWGGPIEFWLTLLRNGKQTVAETYRQMEGLNPEKIIYPHPLSGPLNVYQRMEFLRYHMERHQRQIEQIRQEYRKEV